jgi:hypothetical protein
MLSGMRARGGDEPDAAGTNALAVAATGPNIVRIYRVHEDGHLIELSEANLEPGEVVMLFNVNGGAALIVGHPLRALTTRARTHTLKRLDRQSERGAPGRQRHGGMAPLRAVPPPARPPWRFG